MRSFLKSYWAPNMLPAAYQDGVTRAGLRAIAKLGAGLGCMTCATADSKTVQWNEPLVPLIDNVL